MSVPVTTRLREDVVESLNAAVAAGHAPDRASAIAVAVEDWLLRHDEARIRASYERAYSEHPQTAEEREVIAATSRRAVRRWLADG